MKRLAIAAVAVAAFAWTLTATAAPDRPIHKPTPTNCTAKAFQAFSASVWRLEAWDRGKPPKRVIQAQRRRLHCAPPAHRKAMQHRWQADKRAYYEHRAKKLRQLAYLDAITPPGPAVLAAIRDCESGSSGSYLANTGNGFYGAYQFDLGTWQSVGGSGYPHEAPPREQDERAAELYRRSGPSPWPICGYR